MYYSALGIIALVIHVILNFDYYIDRKSPGTAPSVGYAFFLNSVLSYFAVDALWGFCNDSKYYTLLYIDTCLYYVSLMLTVISWCTYVVHYLKLSSLTTKLTHIFSVLFCLIESAVLIFNFFEPVFFWFDSEGVFHTGIFRRPVLIFQMILFLFIAVPTYVIAIRRPGISKRRYFSIGFCSLVMIVAGFVQTRMPLVPILSIGILITSCVLHVFVHEDEKEEFRNKLETSRESLREKTDIIANAGFGVWIIGKDKEGRNTLTFDNTLLEILGLSEMNLTPVQTYTYYHERILEDSYTINNYDYNQMREGRTVSRIVKWNHPTKGKIYLSAGGKNYTTSTGENFISGYCADVTDVQKTERRSQIIINSLARSYRFLNYVILEESRFIPWNKNYYINEEYQKLAESGDVNRMIEYSCSELIAPEFREEMKEFARLDNINERMEHRHILINQFKDMRGVWHEWTYIAADRDEDGTIKHLIWAVRKIEDEKQAELRKQQILNDNIAANQAKTVFLRNMSHEIRTPLNALFGFAQLLGLPDGSWSEEEKSQFNANIFNNFTMLEMLIDDIIDIADTDNGNYRINISQVQINNTCRNALLCAEYRRPADVKMYFTSDVDDDHVVSSDGRRIQQVLINYLTNACKNTVRGEIHLHCSTTENPGKLTLSVSDTGVGVPAEKADFIFQRFTKLNDFVQGSGLGLNICQMVAEKLGGRVYLDKSYTAGARFVFVIDDIA